MIRFEGSEYEFDLEKTGIEELREIKRKLGLSIGKLMEGLEELDPFCLTAVYWLAMRSDGKHDDLVLSPNLDFKWLEFAAAWAASKEEEAAAAKAEAEADPTPADPDGSLPDTATPEPSGSSTVTSETSATSTSSLSPGTADSGTGTLTISDLVTSSAM